MNLITLLFIALAMSTDAFAAAIGKGATLDKPKLSQALKMGLLFGAIEAITPLIGFMIGHAASSYIEAWDHWIAFIILFFLGGHMIYEALKPNDEEDQAPSKPTQHSWLVLTLTAIGTSIDATAVGISFAFMDVNIWIAALMIGSATCVMVTLGVMIGRVVGSLIGNRAEMMGGIALIMIGSWILYSHLMG
jgi:putative Mn2+ efflux pump MntP